MSDPNIPEAGWYPGPSGAPQWWDGAAWGPLAQQPILDEPPLGTPPPTPGHPVRTHDKPNVSASVWASYGLLAAIVVCAIVAAAMTNQIIMHQMGSFDQSVSPAMPWLMALRALFVPAALAALVCAIVGIVKSRRKAPAIIATVCSALVLASPVILVVLGLLLWGGMGVFSQMSGGPVIG